MARGWESKSVEDQKSEAEADRDAQIKPRLTQQQRERDELKQSLRLSRAQTLRRLEAATNERYRAQLKSALDNLDAQLAQFDVSSDKQLLYAQQAKIIIDRQRVEQCCADLQQRHLMQLDLPLEVGQCPLASRHEHQLCAAEKRAPNLESRGIERQRCVVKRRLRCRP